MIPLGKTSEKRFLGLARKLMDYITYTGNKYMLNE